MLRHGSNECANFHLEGFATLDRSIWFVPTTAITLTSRFQVLTAAIMMFRVVFWDILPCKMIVDRRFRGGLLYNLDPFVLGSLIPDHGGSTHLWNVGRQSFYTAVYPRRQLWTLWRQVGAKSHCESYWWPSPHIPYVHNTWPNDMQETDNILFTIQAL
jgi:hypothetical protein